MKRVGTSALAVAWAMAAVVGVTGAGPASAQVPSGDSALSSARTAASVASPAGVVETSATCPTRSKRFLPSKITMAGVIRNATIVFPSRVNGVPGAPPLTSAGKWQVAMDRKWPIRPGDPYGITILNAHVWPDGSAVGNRMLKNLKIGNRIVVFGLTKKICYRVVDKVVVDASKTLLRYYRTDGKPRLGIVVCSGKRLGPGNWTKRTVWFAKPSR